MIGYYKIEAIWYIVMFASITIITYYALMSVDFSKLFRRSSTWQIKILLIFVSIIFGFLVASGINEIISKILSIIQK
jgi:uncharacterized membrane protein YwzB